MPRSSQWPSTVTRAPRWPCSQGACLSRVGARRVGERRRVELEVDVGERPALAVGVGRRRCHFRTPRRRRAARRRARCRPAARGWLGRRLVVVPLRRRLRPGRARAAASARRPAAARPARRARPRAARPAARRSMRHRSPPQCVKGPSRAGRCCRPRWTASAGAALPVGDRDLPVLAAAAREDEVPAVGRPRRVLAAPAALRDLPHLPRGQVDDRDVEAARLEPRGVGDLAVLLRGIPGAARRSSCRPWSGAGR